LQIHAVDTEAVKLCEGGELAHDAFDFVCEPGNLAAARRLPAATSLTCDGCAVTNNTVPHEKPKLWNKR
jgi:hypothetical protein